jgi:hypothetical protein
MANRIQSKWSKSDDIPPLKNPQMSSLLKVLVKLLRTAFKEPDMVMHTYNPSTQEAEAEGLQV